MLSISPQTMARYLNDLVKKGWLEKRNNPDNSWDRTLQYRYNIGKVASDLLELGYTLQGWKLPLDKIKVSLNGENCISHNEKSNSHSAKCKPSADIDSESVPEDENRPEITSEITNTSYTESVDNLRTDDKSSSLSEKSTDANASSPKEKYEKKKTVSNENTMEMVIDFQNNADDWKKSNGKLKHLLESLGVYLSYPRLGRLRKQYGDDLIVQSVLILRAADPAKIGSMEKYFLER